MEEKQHVKRRWIDIRIFFYFAGTLALVYLMVPRAPRFHYDIQKGKVWTHASLSAPYDYPLYKNPEIYSEERSEILRNVRPIFRDDSTVVRRVLPQIVQLAKLACIGWRDSLLQRNPLKASHILLPGLSEAQSERLESVIRYLYGVGIMEGTHLMRASSTTNFSVLRGQIAYETSLEEVFTPQLASAFIASEMAKTCDDTVRKHLWLQFNPVRLLTPNIHYDSTLTRQLRDERLASLSKTHGVVHSGEKVIGQGDVVTDESYIRLISLKEEMANRYRSGAWIGVKELGYLLLLTVAFALLLLFLRQTAPDVLSNDKKLLFILLLTGIMICVGFLVIRFAPMMLYAVPFAIIPLLARTFLNARLAFTLHLLSVIIVGFFAPDSFRFTLINLVVGILAVLSTTKIYRRGGLFQMVGLILLAYLLTYSGISIIQEGSLQSLNLYMLGLFASNALFTLASYQLMYPVERIFGFISNATLMELCDSNQKLLQTLSEKAPGTFQHSMQMANLAEAAAAEVGGNPLLARTGALYHDIGKINHPEYFVENQELGINPHKALTERESAEIIIRHVIDGIQIAHKHKLPEQIIDFIRTHHGTTRTEYFYRTYRNSHPDEPDHEEWFQYPGPRPNSKETAIVMMADSVEAASRSLKTVTREKLHSLVDEIITAQQQAKQFYEADITFREISIIRKVFYRKLENFYHVRIEYPESPATPPTAAQQEL